MKKLLSLLLALQLCISLMACSTGNGQQTTPVTQTPDNKDSEGSSIEAQTPSAEPQISESPEPATDIKVIGETVMLGEWEITLNSVNTVPEIGASYGSFQPDADNLYVVANLTIKNLAKEAATFIPMFSMYDDIRAKVLYQGEYEYSSTNLLGLDTDLHNRNLNPLSSTEGIIAFEIVEDVATSGDLTLNLSNGVESITFDLK